MKKLFAGTTATLMLAATAWVSTTGAAVADYTSERDALCGTNNACSIDIRDDVWELVEGRDSATVDVTGTPLTTSKLQMYTVEPSEIPGILYRVQAYGSPVPFTTNASGTKTVRVPIAVLQAPQDAGTFVAFQLAGATLESIQNAPIEAADGDGLPDFTAVRSARGADVNETQEVTDGRLVLGVGGGLTGDVYGVQLKVEGTWQDITNGALVGNGKVDADGYADLFADVSGYPDGGYAMRIFNRTRGIYDLEQGFGQGGLTLSKNIYITPGEHLKNGRKWRTTCEGYSATERCRTEIWATSVEIRRGKIDKRTGWFFNNLTYKESPRKLWKGNPLGTTGQYTINGRTWRTECDTPSTGGNGCRSFIVATVVEAKKSGNGYTYKAVTKEVFNNIVLFRASE